MESCNLFLSSSGRRHSAWDRPRSMCYRTDTHFALRVIFGIKTILCRASHSRWRNERSEMGDKHRLNVTSTSIHENAGKFVSFSECR